MELDPSKFALSASMSLLGQIRGAYHATEIYNLNAIVTEGLKTGSDLMDLGRTSGRLHRSDPVLCLLEMFCSYPSCSPVTSEFVSHCLDVDHSV